MTPFTVCQASLSFTTFWNLLKLMPMESVMPSNHLILCIPLLLLPWIFPSIRVFSNELALHIRWPKSFTYSISPSKEYAGWVSLRLTDLISLLSKGLLRVFSSTTVRKHQFFGAQSSSWSISHIHIHNYWKSHNFVWTFLAKRCLCFLIHCLGFVILFPSRASVFWFHGCSHHL